jgi:hypothetical protein
MCLQSLLGKAGFLHGDTVCLVTRLGGPLPPIMIPTIPHGQRQSSGASSPNGTFLIHFPVTASMVGETWVSLHFVR